MYHRSILRRSHVALSLCGIALAAVVVSFAFAALQLGRDASTPAELERVFLEVEAMQDEDVQLTNELRISEETDPPGKLPSDLPEHGPSMARALTRPPPAATQKHRRPHAHCTACQAPRPLCRRGTR